MSIGIEARILVAGLIVILPLAAETTVGDIDRYFDAARRLAAGETVPPRLHNQAGYYAGYLAATRERLLAEGVACPGGCRCGPDAAVEAALLGDFEARQEAVDWLAEVLRRDVDCPE